jgi:hypothetical protein
MPMKSIALVPGVDVMKTLSANEAGVAVSQLIRYKQNMIQKYGGWQLYYPFSVSSTPIRDLHAFQSLRTVKYVGIGSLTKLLLISCGIQTDITPQTKTTNPVPSFSISSGSVTVNVTDSGFAPTLYDSVIFNTPVAVGNLLLNTAYQVSAIVSSIAYSIVSSIAASTTISSGGTLPTFQVTSGSAICDVVLSNNAFLSQIGLYYNFQAATAVDGQTIQGPYSVSAIIDSTHFQIGLTQSASGNAGPTSMNGGNAQLQYQIALGPPLVSGNYGAGNYSSGPYGVGSAVSGSTGTPITATDWILDNSGSALLAVPRGGPLYQWTPEIGLSNAQMVVTAPLTNFGMFVAQPQQIVVMWGSTQTSGTQDPLMVRWSDLGDYTQWQVLPSTFAGAFRIPTGSTLMGGIQSPVYGAAVWTDVDLWLMQYVGQPLVFSFNRMGSGCGLLGPHAADINQGNIFWASQRNFFMLGNTGVQVVPCTVWDYFFQQIDTANQTKVRCASNAVFNEITWFFPILPSLGGTGENTNYVKLHLEGNEFQWDYGQLSRTAWIDVTALGPPIGTDNNGFVYQHEMGNDAAGGNMSCYIQTGWFSIAEGEELLFVDWCIPDMKWGLAEFGTAAVSPSAQIAFTFFTVDYPGDTPRTYGPFTITQNNEYFSPRMRGRLFSMYIQSSDMGSFWRLGRIRFRWAPDGRR